jgi:hypothetical protein
MAGGRPSKGEQQRHPELEELADWFDRAIEEAGYPSHNAVVRAELAHKNVVYGITNAARLFPLLQVKSYAVALGRDPAEVEPLWIRAKEAMDRAADAARRAQAPQLTSWADLPELILSVKTLLQAQARAVERLPYDMLGVAEPPLSAVYVRQRVRAPRKPAPEPSVRRGGEARNEPDQSTGSLRTEARLPVQDALARHEHLLITGEPGAGKSTLTSHLAWTLARIWLRQETSLSAPLAEPVLPVRIAAQALVGESESWSAALDHAVRRTMRLNLVADPAPWLFQSRVQGARWLVLLDGLDEITDPDARRTVVRAIAQHAQAGSDYRFVITSRPLPDAELSPLRTTTLGEYTLEPFGPEELREFAAKWFAAQFEDERQARAATDRFLDETEDSRLRELVRNPLLATIAAVNATVSPGRPLPTHRVTLYQRFFARLLSQGTPAGRHGALRHRLRDDPDRLELHLWLERNRRALLRALGRHRLEREGSLLEAARDWVLETGPASLRALPDWEEDLPDVLAGTGLLVNEEGGFRFLHHSFAEYFAAEAYADEIPADFPASESWFWRAFQSEDHTLPLFVMCLWASRPECAPDLLAERLFSGTAGGHWRPLLAGLLLAEGVAFDESHSLRLIGHLVRIGCCTWDQEFQEQAFEALGSLGHVPTVTDRLEAIARSDRMPVEPRLLAIRALGRCGMTDVAEELLKGLMGAVHGWLAKAAEVAAALGPGARAAVRERALELLDGPSTHPTMNATVLKALARIGMTDDVNRLAGPALGNHGIRSDGVRQIMESWLTATAPENRRQVAESAAAVILDRPVGDGQSHMAVGEVLEKYGEREAAVAVARALLVPGPLQPEPVKWAASALVRAYGQQAAAEIARALEDCVPDTGQYPGVPAQLHVALAGLGGAEEAAAWARTLLERSPWGVHYAEHPVAVWLAAEGPEAVPALMRHIARGRDVLAQDRPDVAQALLDAGARDEAEEVAELALRTPNGYQRGYETSARLLIKNRGLGGVEQLLRIWRSTPALDSSWLRGVIAALPECQDSWERLLPAARELGRALVALPTADSASVMTGLRLLFGMEGADAVPLAVATAVRQSWISWEGVREIAGECVAFGRLDDAVTLWRHVLRQPHTGLDLDLAVLEDIEAAGATAEAVACVSALLDDKDLHSSRRLRLRRLLAWIQEGDRCAPMGSPVST